MKLRAFPAGIVAAAALFVSPARAEPLTIESIIELSKVGLGDDAIVAKIKSDGAEFDLSTDQMIALKNSGVSSAVIAAMLTNKPAIQAMSMDSPDPHVPHPSGLYLLTQQGAEVKMHRIDPTVSNQAKTGGLFGYALTGGLATASIKVSIQNSSALAKAATQPRFYFFFDQANDANASGTWASGLNSVVSSPAEFTLIKLERKSDRREARVGSMNIAGAKTGVMDKDRLAFTHQLVRPGVYQVDVSQPLPNGEYGFIYSIAGGSAGGAMTARIFDFSVDSTVPAPRSQTRVTPPVEQPASSTLDHASEEPGEKSSSGNALPEGVSCDTCR